MPIFFDSVGGEKSLEELINNIVRRPTMYVGNCEFAEVAAFIEGFAFASVEIHNELRDFNRWLAVRLDFPRNWMWNGAMKQIYPDSEGALRELSRLFKEFKQSEHAVDPS